MHARVEAAAHAAASSVAEEVRMVAALGAVTGFDDWAPTLLKDADRNAATASSARRCATFRSLRKSVPSQSEPRLLGVH